ncbi:MAG: SDR family oxidoreductase [Candidatus Hydrogenedentes bacterium]|nr:SDR family oxidoreductase [Candidatus Hydrogenedentota bacterium]
MKIVVIGGSGLIGSQIVRILAAEGHEVVAASPRSGVDTITGEGLDAALAGADVVVDVANSPSFEDRAVLAFFETSGENLATAEKRAGVKHHVALSVVGADRMPDSGYMRAKVAQERIIVDSGVPYSILRATQFYEFLDAIAGSGTSGDTIRLPPAKFQPVASADVAATLAGIVLGAPLNDIEDLEGPLLLPLDEYIRRYLRAKGDPRAVVTDVEATYFGAAMGHNPLVPLGKSHVGAMRLEDWMKA